MKITGLRKVFFGIFGVVFTTGTTAGTYLGLPLGEQDIAKVTELLVQAGARFDDDYGWKGYSQDLPIFKINAYENFDKYGRVKEAWMAFAPDGTPYRLEVTWRDAGELVKILKDALDTKYGTADGSGTGFLQRYHYNDGKTRITLERDTFGFGDTQKTSLSYLYTPALPAVRKMQAQIEQDIKRNNASKAAGDL